MWYAYCTSALIHTRTHTTHTHTHTHTGGYATLAGMTFTPDLYKCGVDIVGPSNIKTLLDSIPPYWGPLRNDMLKKIGDVDAVREEEVVVEEVEVE